MRRMCTFLFLLRSPCLCLWAWVHGFSTAHKFLFIGCCQSAFDNAIIQICDGNFSALVIDELSGSCKGAPTPEELTSKKNLLLTVEVVLDFATYIHAFFKTYPLVTVQFNMDAVVGAYTRSIKNNDGSSERASSTNF